MMDVIDWGRWYTVLPVGGPALLAVGLTAGAAWLVNPLCGAIAVAAAYRFVRLAYDDATARATALLMAVSPFFVFMAAGYQIHTPALAALSLALAALPSWRDAPTRRRAACASAVAIGLALGALVAIRPLDGALAALVIGAFQVAHAARGGGRGRWISIAVQGVAGAVPVALLLLANAKSTGHPLLFGYNVMWGPRNFGFGTTPFGDAHTPVRALVLLSENLMRLDVYLFEWPVPAVLLRGADARARSGSATDWDLLGGGADRRVPRGLRAVLARWILGRTALPLSDDPALGAPHRAAAGAGRRAGARTTRCDAARICSCRSAWSGPCCGPRRSPVRGGARGSTMRRRGSCGVDIGAQERAAGLKNALVIVHEGWGARLMVRMWALGVPRAEAERILPRVGCVRAGDGAALGGIAAARGLGGTAGAAARGDTAGGAAAAAAAAGSHVRRDAPIRRRRAVHGAVPGGAGGGHGGDVVCIRRSSRGIRWSGDGKLGGEIIYARDLGAHNLALRKAYGDRTWYRYVPRRYRGGYGGGLCSIPVRGQGQQSGFSRPASECLVKSERACVTLHLAPSPGLADSLTVDFSAARSDCAPVQLAFRICQKAATPSRHVIFFPSAYVRPWYEIGTSYTRAPICERRATISGSMPKRWRVRCMIAKTSFVNAL